MKLENDELMRSIGRIEAKLEATHSLLKDQKEDQKKLETRIETLEKSKSYVIGAASAISVFAGYIINMVFDKQ